MINVNEKIVETAANITKSCWGLKSHITTLNNLTLGFHPKELTIIAGRSAMGKTAIMVDLVLEISKIHSCLIFSLEMSAKMLMERMIANSLGVSLYDLKQGKIPEENITKIVKELQTRNILIDDTACISPFAIRQKLKNVPPPDSIFIDYLQLMRTEKRIEQWQAVDEMCQDLRAIGKENNIPMIILSQLNREVEKRKTHEPMLADLRTSGGIEQTADCVLLLHRPAYYKMVEVNIDIEDNGEAYIYVAKNRNGATGKIPCRFDAKSMSWKEVSWIKGGL